LAEKSMQFGYGEIKSKNRAIKDGRPDGGSADKSEEKDALKGRLTQA
jgi:hypothetical protein